MNYKNIKIDCKETGVRLYTAFEKSGYKMSELASLLGLTTPRVIYDWFSGIKLPSLRNFYIISKIFNQSMEDLLVLEER